MTVSTLFHPETLAASRERNSFWQRVWRALELSGRRRAARQLILLDDARLRSAGLSRAELEEVLR